MIKLFQFPSNKKLPNFSPFCMKVETYMRMAKIPYEIVNVGNPAKSPKGKLPYIVDDEDNNLTIADSHFIIQYLKDKYGDVLDGHLTPKEKAIALAIEQLLDEHLYWILVYSRWMDSRGWRMIKPIFFAETPRLLRNYIARKVRKKMRKQLFNQGIGRHSIDEVYAIGCEDLDAIAAIIGNNDYLMSDTPTSIDAYCYSHLVNIIESNFSNPLNTHLKNTPILIDYCNRMKSRFFAK